MNKEKWVIEELRYYGSLLYYEVRTVGTVIPSTIYTFPATPEGLEKARERRAVMNCNARVTRKVIE